MRKIVVTEFMSLDGVMEEPRWTFKYWNDEIAKFIGEESFASDALLLGRVTYQGFAAAWPQSKDEGANYFNSVRKYVISETLEEPPGVEQLNADQRQYRGTNHQPQAAGR